MKWIGLTGGIGTGKSTASDLLRSLGCTVIDADQLAREVVVKGSPGLALVVHAFGPGILSKDGSLDRSKLGALIFKDEKERHKLELILHPLIRVRTGERRKECELRGEKIAIYDVPLLFEKDMDELFDLTVAVVTSVPQQIIRLKNRDGLTDEAIQHRLASQLSLDQKIARADYVISNNGTLADLAQEVKKFFQAVNDLD